MNDRKRISEGFLAPPQTQNQDNEPRRIGFELEYAGVDLRESVGMLEHLLDCRAEQENAFRYLLCTREHGDFRIEIDAALLTEGSYKQYLGAAGIETDNLVLERKIDDLIESLASVVVPCEIVTPPLALDALQIVEDIVRGLRNHNAHGTGHSLLYAFGLHINAEVASLDSAYLLNHIRAFALLYDWICRASKVDFSRKLSTYIKPYPEDYLQTIMQPEYAPGRDTLIADYLHLVGSRNHALDMLPVFACLDEDKVRQGAAEPDLVKPRPAFHYRLANSRIDQPSWQVKNEWAYWVQVEALAHDESQLLTLCADFLTRDQGLVFRPAAKWATHIAQTLQLDLP